MINLFKRIYINYDVDLRAGKSQQRCFVTDREFLYPITPNPQLRQQLGITSYHRTVAEFLEEAGGVDGVIERFLKSDDKICLITKPEFATLLHMTVFKSVMKNPTLDAAYLFYKTTYMHQRASSMQTMTSFDDDAAFKGDFPAMYTLEEFAEIYNAAAPCESLKNIHPSALPVELLMANFFINPRPRPGAAMYFLFKYRAIALENAVFRIKVLRNEILTNSTTASQYFGKEIDEVHAIDELLAHPSTAWLADEDLALYSEANVMNKYSIAQFLAIYETIEKLLGISIDERRVLEFLARGEIPELLQEDMKDERGNFIGTEHHFSKVNGVFVNKCYQESRKGNTNFFKQFELIDFPVE